MDVMTAVASQSCLDLSSELEGGQAISVRTEGDSLDSAQYLGSVGGNVGDSVTSADQCSATAPYLQFVTDTGDMYSTGAGSGPAGGQPVYVSPSLYPSSSSPPTTTYYDPGLTASYTSPGQLTSPAAGGAGQSQLVSYAGSTFLIQPSPDGSSTPLITAVTTRPETESPGLVQGQLGQEEVCVC